MLAYLVDTNLVSELIRTTPNLHVLNWFNRKDISQIYISAVGEAELRRGAAILPRGIRRDVLIATIDAMISEDFAGRVLPFDSAAAVVFAEISAIRRTDGRPIGFPDCQIAAIAKSRALSLVTRNIRDFTGIGIDLINPWEESNE